MTSKTIIDYARKENIEAMKNLWRDIPGIGISSSDDTPALEIFLDRNPTTSFVLVAGDQIIGTVLGGYDGRRGYIYHLAIAAAFRRQNLGKQLLDRALSELRKLGASKIHLLVYADNHGAIAFYEKLNWQKRDDVFIFSWEPENFI